MRPPDGAYLVDPLSPTPSAMRAALCFPLALLLLPLAAQAQRSPLSGTDLGSGRIVGISGTDLGSGRLVDFRPADEVRSSDEQMALVREDRDYAAILRASGDHTVTASRGHTLYSSTDPHAGCDREAPCLIVIGKGRLYVPFASDRGLGTTRATSFIVYDSLDKLSVNGAQAEAIADGPLADHLRVDDSTVTGGRGTTLYATDRNGDCTAGSCFIGLEQDGLLSGWGVGHE